MARYAVPDYLLNALIQQESGGRHTAVSKAGARGITQVMGGTGRDPGFGVMPLRDGSEEEYVRFGRDYLGAMLDRYEGDVPKALAAYNAGPGAVDKYDGIPPYHETQNYVKKILKSVEDGFSKMGNAMINPAYGNEEPWQPDQPQTGSDQAQSQEPWVPDADQPAPPSPMTPLTPDANQEPWVPDADQPMRPSGGATGEWVGPSDEGGATVSFVDPVYEGRHMGAVSGPSRALIGIGNSAMDYGRGALQRMGRETVPFTGQPLQQNINEAHQLASDLRDYPGGGVADIAGKVVPVAIAPVSGVAGNLGLAGLSGLLEPTSNGNDWGQVAKNTAIAAAIPVGLAALGKIVGGVRHSPEAEKAWALGESPTVGQGIDKSTLLGRVAQLEEAGTSLTFTGANIRTVRGRAAEKWMQTQMKAAEVPGVISAGGKLGNEGMKNLGKGFDTAYDDLLRSHSIAIADDLPQRIQSVLDNPEIGAHPDTVEWVRKYVENQITPRNVDGFIDGRTWRKIESQLSTKAREYIGKDDLHMHERGVLLGDVEEMLTSLRNSQLPEETANALKLVDNKYAHYKVLQRAAQYTGADGGRFTPAQLKRAAASQTKSDRLRGEGKGLYQEEALRGQRLYGSSLNESGTIPRALATEWLSGKGLAELGGYLAGPTGLTGTGMAAPAIGAGIWAASHPLALGRPAIQKAILGGYAVQPTLREMAYRAANRTLGPLGNELQTRGE